jgi:hypothetical protein
MLENARCETCLFWNQEDDMKSGECRRHPPSVDVGYRSRENDELTGVWPVTYRHDWCGEHKPSSPAAANEGGK